MREEARGKRRVDDHVEQLQDGRRGIAREQDVAQHGQAAPAESADVEGRDQHAAQLVAAREVDRAQREAALLRNSQLDPLEAEAPVPRPTLDDDAVLASDQLLSEPAVRQLTGRDRPHLAQRNQVEDGLLQQHRVDAEHLSEPRNVDEHVVGPLVALQHEHRPLRERRGLPKVDQHLGRAALPAPHHDVARGGRTLARLVGLEAIEAEQAREVAVAELSRLLPLERRGGHGARRHQQQRNQPCSGLGENPPHETLARNTTAGARGSDGRRIAVECGACPA